MAGAAYRPPSANILGGDSSTPPDTPLHVLQHLLSAFDQVSLLLIDRRNPILVSWFKHHAYSEIRTSIMPDKLSQTKSLIQGIAGYSFRNEDIRHDALDTTGLRVQQSNQRMALLGDSILKFVILGDWYPTGTPKGA